MGNDFLTQRNKKTKARFLCYQSTLQRAIVWISFHFSRGVVNWVEWFKFCSIFQRWLFTIECKTCDLVRKRHLVHFWKVIFI